MSMHPQPSLHTESPAIEVSEQRHTSKRDTIQLDHPQVAPSTAAIAGHPIHPAMVTLPIAFLVGAFGADLGLWWTGDPFWARAALWLTGAGTALGIVAAIPGLIDFLTIERARVHRIGWVHAIGNGVVLALAAVNWLLRLGDAVAAVLPWGLVLSAIIAALLVVTGWTSGELAHRHMIGVTGHGGHDHSHAADEAPSMQHDSQTDLHGGRLFVMAWIGAYPIVTLIFLLFGEVLLTLPLAIRTLLLSGLVVGYMVLFWIPIIQRFNGAR